VPPVLAQYDSINCRSQRKGYEWVEMLKSGRTSVSDEARSGHSSTHAQDHIKHANDLIQEDQQNNVSEVGEVLDIRQIETCSLQQKRTAFKNCSLAP